MAFVVCAFHKSDQSVYIACNDGLFHDIDTLEDMSTVNVCENKESAHHLVMEMMQIHPEFNAVHYKPLSATESVWQMSTGLRRLFDTYLPKEKLDDTTNGQF